MRVIAQKEEAANSILGGSLAGPPEKGLNYVGVYVGGCSSFGKLPCRYPVKDTLVDRSRRGPCDDFRLIEPFPLMLKHVPQY